MSAVRVPVKQGSDAWKAVRRTKITASDIPVLLGLSPYKSEATLAAEKLAGAETTASLAMRVGLALEPVIAAEYEATTGRRLRRFHGLIQHPQIDWAAASPDWSVVGERRLVEGKTTGSRDRFAEGEELPQDIEAQVVWQMGCAGYPIADVAVLVGNREFLKPFPVAFNAATFENLVTIAADFRRRLAEGGPFAHDVASLRAAYPADNGAEMAADEGLTEAVHRLLAVRASRSELAATEDALETAIKSRMGEVARLTGPDFTVTWKRTKDTTTVNWQAVADGLLRQLPEPERTALVGIQTTVRPGFRPFRVVLKGDRE